MICKLITCKIYIEQNEFFSIFFYWFFKEKNHHTKVKWSYCFSNYYFSFQNYVFLLLPHFFIILFFFNLFLLYIKKSCFESVTSLSPSRFFCWAPTCLTIFDVCAKEFDGFCEGFDGVMIMSKSEFQGNVQVEDWRDFQILRNSLLS